MSYRKNGRAEDTQVVTLFDLDGNETGTAAFPMHTQGYHTDIATGLPVANFGFEGVQANYDIKDLVSKGGVPGHRSIFEFGRRTSLSGDAAGEDIWQGTAIKIPRPASTGVLMSLVSTDAQDNPAGTGMREVIIFYLDASGDEQSTTVALNGTTPVDIPTTLFRFINAFHGNDWGTGGVAAGTVTLYLTGAATTVYSQINANGNYSEDCTFMVPRGHHFFISNVSATATDNKKILIVLRATSSWLGVLTAEFIFKRGWELLDDSIAESLSPQLVIPEFAVVKATALGASLGGDCTINYSGWIEPI